MVVAYYYNIWGDTQTRVQIEEVADGCDYLEIHEALSAYLALKGISVHEWAIEQTTPEDIVTLNVGGMLKRGKKLIREQND